MTDLEPLEKFQQVFGGKITGPYAKNGQKPYWAYRLNKFEQVQAAIVAMWSFLSPRRREQLATLLKEARHSIQKSETEGVDVRQQTSDGQGVGSGHAQEEAPQACEEEATPGA